MKHVLLKLLSVLREKLMIYHKKKNIMKYTTQQNYFTKFLIKVSPTYLLGY